MIALIRIAEHKLLPWQSLPALGARHILPPQLTVSTSDPIPHIYFIDMVLEGLAPRTDRKSKLLFTAFAAKFVMPFEDGLMLIEDVLPPADAADQLESEGAGDAGDIGSHAVVVLLLVEELQAVLLGTPEVVHGVVAVGACDDLPEVGLV